MDHAHLCHSAGEHAYGGADGITVRFRPDQLETDTARSGSNVIAVKVCSTIVGSEQEIDVSVAIEIRIGEAAADLWVGEAAADRRRYVAKVSTPIVEK